LRDYPVQQGDILSNGQAAWDAALNTVNIGKYNLGWASIGICTHALYEAIHHAAFHTGRDHPIAIFDRLIDRVCNNPSPVARQGFETGRLEDHVP
jgi:alkylation response protein AidB-like acyl-CoA dehydrogenase